MCNVLRQLRADLPAHRSDWCSSAVGDDRTRGSWPGAHRTARAGEKSGAPRGEKFFVFVNPPVVNHQLGIRRSYLGETRRVASEFLKRNLQMIVFAQSRLATEILTTYLKDDFEGVPGGPERIRGYRGGYLPLRRRGDRERAARRAVRAVVSTRASSAASTSAPSTYR
jgi:ATP-dependent helicase YprA (DUF1998 family)